MKKKYPVFMILLLLVSIVMIGIGSVGSIVQFSGTPASLLGRQIYTPQYWVSECVPRADNLQEVQVTSHTDDPTFYYCTTEGSQKATGTARWIPQYPGIQCQYTVDTTDFSTIYICEGIIENKKDLSTSKCKKESGFFISSSRKSFSVNAGDTININTNQLIRDAKLYVKYPSYGIKATQADGFISKTTLNCLTQSLSGIQLHSINLGEEIEVKPDNPFNAVSALSPAVSTQAVTLSYVEGGKPIYISRPGYYFLIKTADDGFEYVDTQKESADSNIQCIPRTSGCSDEAKIVKLEDQSCDKFGGAITDYAPVQGDSAQLCKYSCSGGKLKKTSSCIKIPASCPADKPLFDSQTGKCTGQESKEKQKEFNFTPVYILLAGLILAGVMYAIRMRRK